MKLKYIIMLITLILLLSLVNYLPITHPLKNNYMGMTRSDVIKVLFKKIEK